MSKTITMNIPDIMTLDGLPTPEVSEVGGDLVIEYRFESPDAAVKGAKAAVRELVKFRLDKGVQGTRNGSKIMFAFTGDGEIPATWRGRAGSAHATGAKPAVLTEIQEALKPYAKAAYFNSSVNEGLTVEDVPVGLQFEASGEYAVAKLLVSKKGEWTECPIADSDQAVALVERLQGLLKGL